MKSFIYGLTDPRDGSVRYIGKTTTGMERPRAHRYLSDGDHTHKAHWILKLQREGLEYGIVVLEECVREDLSAAECFWIAQGRGLGWRLTNLTKGGDGTLGFVQPEHVRVAVASANTRRKGVPFTEEHKARMSASMKGQHRPRWSEETREKIMRGQSAARARKRGIS